MFVQKISQSGVITAFNKVRKTRRRMCDKTIRENVTTKLSQSIEDIARERRLVMGAPGDGMMLREQMMGK